MNEWHGIRVFLIEPLLTLSFLHLADFFCMTPLSSLLFHSPIAVFFNPFLGWLLRLWQRWISWFDWDFWDHYEASSRSLPQRSSEIILNTLLISVPDERVKVSELKKLICLLQAEFDCVNSKKKQKKKNYKNSGVVSVKVCQVLWHKRTRLISFSTFLTLNPMQNASGNGCFLFQITREYTFLDYIMGGCQINFTVSSTFSFNST